MNKKFLFVVLFVCLAATKAYSAGSFTDGINSDGVFNIITALDESKAVDVYGAKTDDGTNVQLYQLNDTLNQQFEIKYVKENFYKIIDKNSKKALTVTGSISRKSSGVGFDVKISNYGAGKDTQLWQLESIGNGYYFIKSKLGLYCLTVGNASTKNETNIIASYKNWSNAQKFKLRETQPYEIIEEGTYIIESALDPNMAVDLYGGFRDNGTNIQLWEKNGTKAQEFVISYYENGYYEIADYEGDKVLDVAGGRNKLRANVQLYEYDETDGQFWRFYKQRLSGKDYYFIRSKLGYVIDVTGGVAKSGTNIQIYGKYGKGFNQNKIAGQLFKLTKYEPTQKYYVTTRAGLNLRSYPSSYGGFITTMPYGSEIEVSNINNGWATCTYNETAGYCSASYISTTQPASGATNYSYGQQTSDWNKIPNNPPNMNSTYYRKDNPQGIQKAYGANGKNGCIDCCFYARSRAMERHGWNSYQYNIFNPSTSIEAIKGGDCVVWFHHGTNGSKTHAVYVEYYDAANDIVYFSDANMGSPKDDGKLKSMSFSDFQTYGNSPGWYYSSTENRY